MNILNVLASGDNGGIEKMCVDYARYTEHREDFLFIYRAGNNAEDLKKMNKRVITIKNNTNSMSKLINMLRVYKANNYDIVTIHHTSPISYLFGIILKLKKISPIVNCYAHSDLSIMKEEDSKYKTFLNTILIHILLRLCDNVITISQSVNDSVVKEIKVCRDKCELIYNGVDASKIIVNTKGGMYDEVNLMYVGRLVEEKGVQNIICILKEIKNDFNFRFYIVGDGDYRTYLQDKVKDCQLEDRIIFLGNRNDVPELLSKVNLFIHLPEVEEGFGLTIVEAMMTGLICISSDKGAIKEIIEDGINGFLINKKNGKWEIDKFKNILKNSMNGEYNDLIYSAISTGKKFGIHEYVEKMNKLYENQMYGVNQKGKYGKNS